MNKVAIGSVVVLTGVVEAIDYDGVVYVGVNGTSVAIEGDSKDFHKLLQVVRPAPPTQPLRC